MPVVKLTIEYEGTRYVGWQLQRNGASVQGEIERALGVLHKSPRRVVGAGRTDAGVHALGQVCSFSEERPLPLTAYVKGMNAVLQRDVAIRRASIESDDFDARRSAQGKRYRYRIANVETRAPLSSLFTWQIYVPLDVEAMRQAARPLLGRHDFAAFQASDCQAPHAVRDLRRLEVLGETRGEVAIVAEATAFVKHMVRNIVGTLVEVGVGKRGAATIPELLEGRDRRLAGPIAPPQGLCLEEVFYSKSAGSAD